MTTRKNKKSNKRFRKTRSKRQRGGGNIPSSTKRNQEEKKKDKYLLDAIETEDADEVRKALDIPGANVNAHGECGVTALAHACLNENIEIVELLLTQDGIDVDMKDEDGFTPLMRATEDGFTEIVDKLLDAGADVDAASNDGQTALYWAKNNRHTDIVKLLIRNGATIPDDINNREDLLEIKEKIEREKSHQNLAVIRAAAVQNGKTTMSEAGQQVFSFVPGQKPSPGDYLGGKRKTKKNKQKRRKKTKKPLPT